MNRCVLLLGLVFSIQGNCPERFEAQAAKVELSLDSVGEIDCFVVLRSTVKQPVTVFFYYKKDRIGSGQDIVTIQASESFTTLACQKGTCFVIPRYRWCEKVATGGLKPAKVHLVDALKGASIEGLSVAKLGDVPPKLPMVRLGKREKQVYYFEVTESKTGVLRIHPRASLKKS